MTISTSAACMIVDQIAEMTGIPATAIVGDSHAPSIVAARHRVFVALRGAGASYPEIGRLMQRHHTTVLHGVRKVLGQ